MSLSRSSLPGFASPERQTSDVEAYGEHELALGVATNRETQKLLRPATSTAVYFSTTGEVVHIDIQNDSLFSNFLYRVKSAVLSGEPNTLHDAAHKIAHEVVASTPVIDETGVFHQWRNLTLGDALNRPVECIDRALAMEAAFKMFGVHDAQMLIGVDRLPNGTRTNHADVGFTMDNTPYVAITMGARAGEVVAKEEYVDHYLPQRETAGLGARTLQETWSYPYFETVNSI